RPSLYDPMAVRPEPVVPRSLRLEIRGRIGPDGRELQPLDVDTLPARPDGVEAVAVSLLHSDLNDSHERAVAAYVAAAWDVDVVCSAAVSPEFREYERTLTTVVNAYLRPVTGRYLERLRPLAGD